MERLKVFLDLDKTLVLAYPIIPTQSAANIAEYENLAKKMGGVSRFTFEIGEVGYVCFERPHVRTFLEHASRSYDLYVYTASEAEYARKICQHLEQGKRFFRRVYSREHCLLVRENLYFKSFAALARVSQSEVPDVDALCRRTVMVDDSIYSHWLHPNNGVMVSPFGEQSFGNDAALLLLLTLLRQANVFPDVRVYLKAAVDVESTILAMCGWQFSPQSSTPLGITKVVC